MKLSRAISYTALSVLIIYAVAVLLGAPLLRHLSHKRLFARRLLFGGIFGAWLGAFFIPLDWDRWWQRWPVPCVFGVLLGGTVGFLTSSYKLFLSWLEEHRKLEKFV